MARPARTLAAGLASIALTATALVLARPGAAPGPPLGTFADRVLACARAHVDALRVDAPPSACVAPCPDAATCADRLARALLATRRAGDARLVLSERAFVRGDHDEALAFARAATAPGTPDVERLAASAALQRSRITRTMGRFEEALVAAEDAVAAAGDRRDGRTVIHAHLARSDTYRAVGAWKAASDALDAAIETAARHRVPACDLAWIHLKRTILAEEDDRVASAAFTTARAPAIACFLAGGGFTTYLALRLNEAAQATSDAPSVAAEILDELDHAPINRFELSLLRARLAARTGDLDGARRHLATADHEPPPDADWAWDAHVLHAELALAAGGPFAATVAEVHYRRAIASIEALRGDARDDAATLLASHRAPFEGLSSLFARQGRWRELLGLVLAHDASDMVGGVALPPVTDALVDLVIASRTDRPLVVAIAPVDHYLPGHDRAYRLVLRDGTLTGEDVGEAAALRAAAAALYADDGDLAAARTLGRALVPDDGDRRALDLQLSGVLGRVPIAALRDDGGALVLARRPLARALSLRPRPAPPDADGAPVVLADPTGDLAEAFVEGGFVADTLGVRARAGAAARRDALLAAGRARVLHVAAHIDLGARPALHLAPTAALGLGRRFDPVHPPEIVRARLAPGLVFLASCEAARARDDEGWGSIAAAFLEAGAPVVIATDRRVRDPDAQRIVRAFYEHARWREDPVAALADVQVELARIPTGVAWAAFVVLRGPPPGP